MTISKLHLVALQTVIPTKPTDPRSSHKVIVPQDVSPTLRRRFHVVLYYKKSSDEDSGWAVAGWIKESLGRALEEQPIIAGRIRPCEDQNDDVALEIVANDSGVRMVEARVDMDLAGFLDLKAKGADDAEAELVFWEDVMEGNPQFSPLVYVQITNFSCGGYAIGISCSLLLADPFVLTTFLNRWANIHRTLFSKPDFVTKMPTFYFPSFGNHNSSSSQLLGSIEGSKSAAAQSVILKTRLSDDISNSILAAACIKEAEHEAGRNMAPKISLVTKLPSEDCATKVEICSREELLDQTINNPSGKINSLDCVRTWDELGLDSICFNEGYKPIDTSCWINSVLDEGSVIIMPSNDLNSGMRIIVTFS